jgi:hypothetical protein
MTRARPAVQDRRLERDELQVSLYPYRRAHRRQTGTRNNPSSGPEPS